MPKGITQEQVNGAADALVATGDKPTVEKIRAQLGTGSPNTVTRMLDIWRGTLAQRMQDVLKLPEAPSEVGQAFVEVWRLAVTQAESIARASLAQEQNALLATQTSLAQERKIWEIAIAEAQANVAECTAKLAQAEMQWAERQALFAQVEAQRGDLLTQRGLLQEQVQRLSEELAHVRAQFAALESVAASERETATEHIRAVEDRTSREIDRGRQDLKTLQHQLATTVRDHDKRMARVTAERDTWMAALRTAEKQAALQNGRADALERQLSRKKAAAPKTKKRVASKSK
jgi:chromosome segregation ATPase